MSDPQNTGDERYMVPGLVRGLSLLESFSGERSSLPLADLSRVLGASRSSTFRIAYTLTKLGYLVRDDETKRYKLGNRVLALGFGYLSSLELAESARPHLEALRDRTDCSAHLAVLDGVEIVYVARYADKKSLTSRIQVGSRLPAHATTMGRAILSQLSPADVRERFEGTELKRFSTVTATNVDELIRQLTKDATRGCVISRSNFERGVASLAAPVFDADGTVAGAINITTPESTLRGDELETSIKDAVMEASATISKWLGHRGERRSA